MAIRQYIGARYVPRFLGTYDVTQIYDALDVVDNGSGTSYIARKTVPAGTPLTNTEYWFVYGASSGAIIALQNDMIAAQNDILGLQSETSDLYSNKQDEMKNRVFLFVGDSYDVQTSYLDDIGTNIKCKSYTKRSHTGAGFYKYNSNFDQYYFLNILQTLDPLTTEEKETITDVVFVVAVGNDNPQQDSDLANAIRDLDTWLRANCPKLRRIALYPVGWMANNQTIEDKMLNNLSIYARVTPVYGWAYVDCTRVMRTAAYFDANDPDHYHPTNLGGIKMGRAVTNAILSGCCSYEELTDDIDISYGLALPASWSGATIDTPSNGVAHIYEKILASGEIEFGFKDWPMVIQHVDFASGTYFYDITLGPAVTGRDPLAANLRMAYPLGFYSNKACPIQCALLIKRADGSPKIRIYTNGTAATDVNFSLMGSKWILNR